MLFYATQSYKLRSLFFGGVVRVFFPYAAMPLRFQVRRLMHTAVAALLCALTFAGTNIYCFHLHAPNIVSLFIIRFAIYLVILFVAALVLQVVYAMGRPERRVLKGTKLLIPSRFNRVFEGAGIGFPVLMSPGFGKRILGTPLERTFLHIKAEDEPYHFEIFGDSGTGKSALIHTILQQLEQRPDDTAVIYDPALEFWETWGEPRAGDILLFPLAEACPYWNIRKDSKFKKGMENREPCKTALR